MEGTSSSFTNGGHSYQLRCTEGAWQAIHCATDLADRAGLSAGGANHLLLGIVDADQIGARALTSAGVTRDLLEQALAQIRRPLIRLRSRSRAPARADKPVAVALYRPKLARRLFAPKQNPAAREFGQALTAAFQIAHERNGATSIDSGDLLLGALTVLSDTSASSALRHAGVDANKLAGAVEHERQAHPENQRTEP